MLRNTAVALENVGIWCQLTMNSVLKVLFDDTLYKSTTYLLTYLLYQRGPLRPACYEVSI